VYQPFGIVDNMTTPAKKSTSKVTDEKKSPTNQAPTTETAAEVTADVQAQAAAARARQEQTAAVDPAFATGVTPASVEAAPTPDEWDQTLLTNAVDNSTTAPRQEPQVDE
jgi:hypothetical protein